MRPVTNPGAELRLVVSDRSDCAHMLGTLAAAHGGELTVDTKPGRGAAFHLRLPQTEAFQLTATESQDQKP